MKAYGGDVFVARRELELVDSTLQSVNGKLICTGPSRLQLNGEMLYGENGFSSIYQPTVGQFVLGTLRQPGADGWLVDLGTTRDALLLKQYVTKQALVAGNYVFCKVLQARPGAQTLLKYEDATCVQLSRAQGVCVELNQSCCVRLSLSGDLQSEIAKRVRFALYIGLNGRIFVAAEPFDAHTVRWCLERLDAYSKDADGLRAYLLERERAKARAL